jgi:hypothetical protein
MEGPDPPYVEGRRSGEWSAWTRSRAHATIAAMIERLFLQIAQVGALFTLALGGYAVAAAGAPLKIRDLKLFPDTEKGHFGTPHKGYELPADQKRQLFILVFDKTAAGQQAAVRVIATKTTVGLEKEVKRFPPVVIDQEGRLPIELSSPRPWPAGFYRLEVSDGKSLIGQVGYQVKAAVAKKTPIKVQGVKIFHDKAGGGVEEVQAPKATDRHQYFAVETRGAQTDGAKVTWVITAVDTSKGKNQKVSGVDIDKWPLDDTTITLDIELPGSWPTGKYKLELFVDGASIGAHSYEIKP